MTMRELITHPFEPIYNSESKVLILGTLPSRRSREAGFYYAHPTNQFWKLLAAVCGLGTVPATVEAKTRMLLDNRIALWDVFERASIHASSDASISRETSAGVNLDWLGRTRITQVFVNGRKAEEGYNWFLREQIKARLGIDIEAIALPSSSAANARLTFEQKLAEWLKVRDYIEKSNRCACQSDRK